MPAVDAATKGDALVLLVVGVVTVFTLVVLAAVRSRRGRGGAPSPRSVLLLGHLHLLGKPLHRSLAALAAAHGGGGGSLAPLLSLRLGARRALLVSTHDAAAECFTARDAALAGRPRLLAGDILGYGFTDILWAPYGDHWRAIRKFFTAELLSTSRLAARAADRRSEVAALVENLRRDADADGSAPAVTLRPRLFEFVINVMLRALIGACVDARDARRFQEIIEETVKLIGTPCVGDLYPSLRWVDRLRGVDAALTRMQARRDALLVGLLDDHRRKRDRDDAGVRDAGHKGAAIDELLSLQELDPKQYTDAIVKGIVMAILQGGTDTSSLTMEWAMALLLQHPEAMTKARAEIDAHVGTSRLVEESDISNLPYLQCVVKETLRLCPVGPIIPAHEAMEDCTVGGFHVQRGTMILVNAWAIQRDPKVWDAPQEFRPERFMDGGGGAVTAAAVPMLPFGIGRRRCPAENLAMRLVSVTVAGLVQCFEWGVSDGAGVDMAEGGGLSMPMATPLAAVCRPREFVQSMLSASA